VGFLLSSREPWIERLREFGWVRFVSWPEDSPKKKAALQIDELVVHYLVLTTGVLLVLLAATALVAPDHLTAFQRIPFPAGAVVGAIAALLGIWATRGLAGRAMQRKTWIGNLIARIIGPEKKTENVFILFQRRYRTQKKSPEGIEEFHRASGVFFLGQILFFILCGLLALTPLRWLLPAGLVIAVFVSAVVTSYGALRWRYDERRFWLLAFGFAAWVGLAAWGPYRHTLYDLQDAYKAPVPVSVTPSPNPALIKDLAALEAWSGGAQKPLVVLAVDGGGVRAATWVTALLTTLEQDIPQFPHHVRVITGASGGMVGAAYYVATLQPPSGARAVHSLGPGQPPLGREEMIRAIAKDSLEVTVQRLFFRDISPVPLWNYLDRGWVLERQWEQNTGSLHVRMRDLAGGEAAGWRPSLIFSPMIVEDGRRLLISNLDLADLTTTETGAQPIKPSLSAVEFAKLVPQSLDIRLSSAARLSAAVAYVTPAAEIPTEPLRRVVDAGYYEEHGVDLATSWLLTHARELPKYASKVVLIQVPDQRTEPNRVLNPCPPGRWSRGLSELVSPPQAIFAGWTAAQTFRNDQTVSLLSRTLNANSPDYFRSYVFEPYKTIDTPSCLYTASADWQKCAEEYCDTVASEKPVALSWHIVTRDRDRLRDAPWTNQNCKARQGLVQWWTGQGATLPGCEAPVLEASRRR
jgi:hypothetical protein